MSQRQCPQCDTELPAGAPEGLCPKCLLAAGLESGERFASSEGAGWCAPTTPHPRGFIPPEPAALSARFPQLEILEVLGHGGMGAVYKARQPKLDRMVALKIIRPESADDPAFAERFNREARLLARLSHPNIVAVYDFGEVTTSTADVEVDRQTKLYFFLMEFVDGANLRQLMQDGRFTPEQALAIVPQICEALQFAHDEGVVHRDIKPENVLLDGRGRIRIADFGLAKLAGPSQEEFTLTGTNQVMGTPRYMAPEQMEGSHAVDHRADIYSLGVVFYEMLTGEVPMGRFEPPSKKIEVDVRLDEVVLRALAREPDRRYQHASDLKTDVEVLSHKSTPAPMAAKAKWGSRLRSLLNAIGWPFGLRLAISLLTLGLVAYGWFITCVVHWGSIFSSRFGHSAASGFVWWQGMLVFYSFAGIVLALIATMPRRQVSFWKPLLISLGAILVLFGASNFISQLTKGTLPVQPFLHAAGRSLDFEGERPETINDLKAKAEVKAGPYVAIVVAICVLLLVALELAVSWRDYALLFGEQNTKPAPPVPNTDHAADVASRRSNPLALAWDDWWAQRDRWIASAVKGFLVTVTFVSVLAFFGNRSSHKWVPGPDGKLAQHVTIELGPTSSPWFRSETGRGWAGDPSWSYLLLVLAFSTWYVRWQIVKAQAQAESRPARWTDGSPGFLVFIVAGFYVIVMLWAISLPYFGSRTPAPSKPSSEAIENGVAEAPPTARVHAA